MQRTRRKLPAWCKEAKKALIDRDQSIASFAEEIGMSRAYASQVINGYRYAPEIAARISTELHLDVDYIDTVV